MDNILNFPNKNKPIENKNIVNDKIMDQANWLKSLSKYRTDFDFSVYQKLAARFGDDLPKGGVVYGKGIHLWPTDNIQVDTYGRGCVHDCSHCPAKDELTIHGYWNRPFPMPLNIANVWSDLYYAFEAKSNSKLSIILRERKPLNVGIGSDPFMFMDIRYKITFELLKLLSYYNYPYVLNTKSDLISHDDYLEVLRPDLATIQVSLMTLNDSLGKLIEAGAPNSIRRLKAITKLKDRGFKVNVKIGPFLPNVKDLWDSSMFQTIKNTGANNISFEFPQFRPRVLNQIEKDSGLNLRSVLSEQKKFSGIWEYSEEEKQNFLNNIDNLSNVTFFQKSTK